MTRERVREEVVVGKGGNDPYSKVCAFSTQAALFFSFAPAPVYCCAGGQARGNHGDGDGGHPQRAIQAHQESVVGQGVTQPVYQQCQPSMAFNALTPVCCIKVQHIEIIDGTSHHNVLVGISVVVHSQEK